MDLYEYEAKELFLKHGINTLPSIICKNPEEVYNASAKYDCLVVVKAQVKTGGRGKAGGVKLAKTPQEAKELSAEILGMKIKDHLVEQVMVTPAADIKQEYYFSMMVDRSAGQHIAIISAEGGVDIETLAKTDPDKIVKHHFTKDFDKQIPMLIEKTFTKEILDDKKIVEKITQTLEKLYECYVKEDATLVEVNPLVLTDENDILALDAKVTLDDNASIRHSEHEKYVHIKAEDPKELEAKKLGLNYVHLQGEVGIIGNGAGLVMSTLDVVQGQGEKFGGIKPANFLDIGGGASSQTMSNSLNLVLSDEQVQSVFINVFGGITACDKVAEGIVKALGTIDENKIKPIVIRLDGNAVTRGLDILREYAHPSIIVVETMDEAAYKACELVGSKK